MTLEGLINKLKEAIIQTRKERDTAIAHRQFVEEVRYQKRVVKYTDFLNYLYKELKEELEEQKRAFDPDNYKR